jgi:hypothetical protein
MSTPTPRTCGELSCDECNARTAAITTERDQLRAEVEKVYALVTPVGFDLPGGIFETAQAVTELRAERDQLRAEVERLNKAIKVDTPKMVKLNNEILTGIGRLLARAERAEAEIIRLRTENSDLKATDTRPLLTGSLTHAGLCRIHGELVDGVFIAVAREQIKACPRLPMYQEIELRIAADK